MGVAARGRKELLTRNNTAVKKGPLILSIKIICLKKNLKDVSSDLLSGDMQAYLQSISNMGPLQVTRSGDCAGYTWRVRWNTGGRKSLLTVSKNLSNLFSLGSMENNKL